VLRVKSAQHNFAVSLKQPDHATSRRCAEEYTQDTAEYEERDNRHAKGVKPTLLLRILESERCSGNVQGDGMAFINDAFPIRFHFVYLLSL